MLSKKDETFFCDKLVEAVSFYHETMGTVVVEAFYDAHNLDYRMRCFSMESPSLDSPEYGPFFTEDEVLVEVNKMLRNLKDEAVRDMDLEG